MRLIVVESPTKARTLSGFLGKDYEVLSSFGHVRDLPKGKLGIDVNHNFEPSYVIPTKARKVVSNLKKEAKKADEVILATDEDREGESIAWHLEQVLDLENPQRIVFHEITKSAIKHALQNPRSIDMPRVEAQQARRILDRLVGYELSPFLWQKIAKRLSAGRVQSVAVRLIVEREREIKAFVAKEYWTVEALLKKSETPFSAFLAKKNGKAIEKYGIASKEEADAILRDLENAAYIVESVEQKEVKRNPFPPFTTSTLQQEAEKKLHFSAKFTMSLAQQLYEIGLITYHRTDSLNLSEYALLMAKDFIIATYGKEYWPGSSRVFKTKTKGAQEAHEAIRPTNPGQITNNLSAAQLKLYELVQKRFLASQMAQAIVGATSIDIKANLYTFRATGQMLKFDGFLKVYPIQFEEAQLPELVQNEMVDLEKLVPAQHFTEPPPRYSEATLIKTLEENEIGRPSTYAPTISTVQDRGYIAKDEKRRLYPTDLGSEVNDMLVKNFPQIVDIAFTAHMEQKLDDIAKGQEQWVPMIQEFYEPFAKNLAEKYKEVPKKENVAETTSKICPKCGSPVVIRSGRFGKFYACSTYPKCNYTESLEEKTDGIAMKCPKCTNGNIVMRRTKRGKMFYGCSRYPECDFASWTKPEIPTTEDLQKKES